jgi:hypothetical protein
MGLRYKLLYAGDVFAPGHVVEVTPGTWLAPLTGVRNLRTNAWHHQGLFVDGLADGVRAAAKTSDGVVEAIELSPELIHKMTSGERMLASIRGRRAMAPRRSVS